MTSVFDFDDSINTIYNAKTAGKNLVTAKHEVLTKAGEFLFLAHSDKEFALRCQMMEADIESAARRKMATVSDSKFKLVRALHEEWKIRHANCDMCNLKESATMCHECKTRPATKKAHGYLDVCDTCDKSPGTTAAKSASRKTSANDSHHFYDKVGPCATCGQTTGHMGAPNTPHEKSWKCPPGACNGMTNTDPDFLRALHGSKFAAGEASSLGRAHGEGMQCGASGPFAIRGCGAVNPKGGLGGNTGLCLNCESKAGFKTPAHDYQGNTRGDVTASKFAAGEASSLGRAHGEGMQCQGCGAKSPQGGLGGNTGLCLGCEDKAGFKTPAHDYKGNTRGDVTASSVQSRISSLRTRVAFPFELDKANQNRTNYSVTSNLGARKAQELAAKYADRTADRPEMAGEAKAGRWAMITKHDASGNIIDATLGRINGSALGGEAETSPLICTGNTHHGSSGCVHPEGDAFGGRHIALQETPAMEYGDSLFPRLQNRKEASIYAPSHRVYVLPQEDHDTIERGMDQVASEGIPELDIPAFKREEEGRGRTIESLGRGSESEDSGPGVNTAMGRSLSVGKVSGFTLWPSDKNFGHYENELARTRGAEEGTSEVLESGPRERKGVWTKGGPWGKLIPGQEGKSGSGRVLPVATMLPEYNSTDRDNGMAGALPDGSSAGRGITPKLRPLAWGTAFDAPTFKFLSKQPTKATGESLRQKLVAFNEERKQRAGAQAEERAQANPSKRPSPKQQVSTEILNRLLGK